MRLDPMHLAMQRGVLLSKRYVQDVDIFKKHVHDVDISLSHRNVAFEERDVCPR